MDFKYLYINTYLFALFLFIVPVSAKKNSTIYDYSSTQFLDEIKNSQKLFFQNTIRFYDSLFLQKKEVKILIEKCRFMENALYDEESEENPKYDDWEICYNKLLNDFPDNPYVLYYKLEHLYGDSVLPIARDLLPKFQSQNLYDPLIISHIYEKIARSFSNMDSTQNAISAFQSALKYNDTIKVHLSLAQEIVNLGQREKAYRIILQNLSLMDTWEKRNAAELLIQLRYPDDAVKIYSKLLADTTSYFDYSTVAIAYEKAEIFDSARIFQY